MPFLLDLRELLARHGNGASRVYITQKAVRPATGPRDTTKTVMTCGVSGSTAHATLKRRQTTAG